jgi:hypothetical protein
MVLAVTFLFSLSVGIFVSALSQDARHAMGANLLLLLTIIAIPPGIASMVYLLGSQQIYPELLLSCPVYSLYLCDDSTYSSNQSYFWCSVGTLLTITWLLLAAASRVIRHAWQDRPADAGPNALRRLWTVVAFGPVSKRVELRAKLLNINAFYWLAGRTRVKPLQVWGVLIFIGSWWVWAVQQLGILWLDDRTSGTNLATAIMLNVALKLWVAMESGRQLAEERQSGSFELLLSTCLTPQDIFRGQWLALRRQFQWPVLLSAAVTILFMYVAVDHSVGDNGSLLLTWMGGLVLFVADLAALRWSAMYAALITKSPNQAAMATISRILIAPWIALFLIGGVANAVFWASGATEPPFSFYLTCWLVLGILTDLIYGLVTRARLRRNFRHLACHGRPTLSAA